MGSVRFPTSSWKYRSTSHHIFGANMDLKEHNRDPWVLPQPTSPLSQPWRSLLLKTSFLLLSLLAKMTMDGARVSVTLRVGVWSCSTRQKSWVDVWKNGFLPNKFQILARRERRLLLILGPKHSSNAQTVHLMICKSS